MTGRQRGSDIDSTGRAVASQLRRVRESRGLDLRSLAERLRVNGRYISASALSKIENEARRVDVDDLLALAVALDASPLSLLIDGDELPTTMPSDVTSSEVLAWARGETHIDPRERLGFWERRARDLIDEIDQLEQWADNMLAQEASPNVRRIVAEQTALAELKLTEAKDRIGALKSDPRAADDA